MIFIELISVQFENADFMAGFTQRRGVFTVPYDGVYEFGVSLRLDVSLKFRSPWTEIRSEVIPVSYDLVLTDFESIPYWTFTLSVYKMII